jgi:hypothetical protein
MTRVRSTASPSEPKSRRGVTNELPLTGRDGGDVLAYATEGITDGYMGLSGRRRSDKYSASKRLFARANAEGESD